MKKGLKINIVSAIMAVLIVVAIIPLNILSTKFDVKFDMTPNKMYSLDDVTQKVLTSLEKEVEIILIADIDELKKYKPGDEGYMELKMVLTSLDKMSEYEKIKVSYYSPYKEPEKVKALDPDDILQLTYGDIVVKVGDNKRKVKGNTLTTVNNQTSDSYYQGETLIVAAINYLVNGTNPSIVFLTGHGEKKYSEYDFLATNLKSQNYVIEELDLTKLDKEPKNTSIMIVAAPKNDLSNQEKEKIDEYMLNGGNMILMMSPNDAKLDYLNFEKIMYEYGISMDYNKVFETDENNHAPNDKYFIISDLQETELTSALVEDDSPMLAFIPNSRSFYPAIVNNEKLKVTSLIKTKSTTTSETFGGTHLDAKIPQGTLDLAIYAEDESRKDSKLMVFGSADMLTDKTLAGLTGDWQTSEMPMTINLFFVTVSWMDLTDTNIMLSNKMTQVDYISIPNKKTGDFLLVIMISVPILISVVGVIVWLRRRNS